MLFFAIFTVGYFAGVITVLFIFPPNTNELREQEFDTVKPILEIDNQKELGESVKERIFDNTVIASN